MDAIQRIFTDLAGMLFLYISVRFLILNSHMCIYYLSPYFRSFSVILVTLIHFGAKRVVRRRISPF